MLLLRLKVEEPGSLHHVPEQQPEQSVVEEDSVTSQVMT